VSNLDAVSKAFGEAADLEGDARAAYLRTLRQTDPATAQEVESLLGFHEDTPSPTDGDAGSQNGRTGAAASGRSVLDRPVAVLLGMTAGSEDMGAEDEPSLPPGTLLNADGLGEPGDGSTWSFKIISELGRGGMGVVYEAEQAFPSRRVALKLLRGGVARGGTTVPTHGTVRDGATGIGGNAARRLMLEAEALGALHHPGIAHVHAAGTLRLVTDPTAPPTAIKADRWLFISMELVEGPTLGVWAKDRTLREKIAMVAELCDAVEHAHQRGVVHRDLKPGNVLVEMGGQSVAGTLPASAPPVVGQPKVLDFGVARLTNRNRVRPDATLNIGRGQLIGTLRYMSPEQASGGGGAGSSSPVDSRSDVYALGAILYELVAGTPPIPVDDASIVGAVERIVSQTPARPQGLAAKLGARGAADLETVLFKTLAKEPKDRYQHASDLGADLSRILADEPISARPPTAREQLMRLVRRNRVATAAVAAGLLLLVAGASVATWQAVRATEALAKAREEAAIAQSALYFTGRMIAASTPNEARGQDVTVREMLRAATREVRSMPDDRATATACRLLADALQEVGELADAEPLARRALAIDREQLGEDARETIEAGILTSHIAMQRGRQTEALTDARSWRERCVSKYGLDDRLSFRTAMAVEYALGCTDPAETGEAEALLRDTIERIHRVLPLSDRNLYAADSDLCALLLNTGRPAEALPIAEEVYKKRSEILGEDHPETLIAMSNLTGALADMGDMKRALELNARNVELSIKVLGPDHPGTQYARQNWAQLLLRQGRCKEAEPIAKATWEARARRLGADTRPTMDSQGLYISCVLNQAKFDEAEPMIRAFIARNEELFGPRDDDTLKAVTLLYDLAEGRGDKKELEAVTTRLKGTKFDPAKMQQLPAIGSQPKEPEAKEAK
jgi:serine/threonine protein kinase